MNTVLPIRPLTIAELLDAAVRLYRSRFLVSLLITALFQIVIVAGVFVLTAPAPHELIDPSKSAASFEEEDRDELRVGLLFPPFRQSATYIAWSYEARGIDGQHLGHFGFVLALALGIAIVNTMNSAALVESYAQRYLGSDLPPRRTRAYATLGINVLIHVIFGESVSLLMVILLSERSSTGYPPYLPTVVALTLTHIGILTLTAAMMPAALIERCGAWHAMRRSIALVWRSIGRTFVVVLLMALAAFVIYFAAMVAGVQLQSLAAAYGFRQLFVMDFFLPAAVIAPALVLPLQAAFGVALYFEARTRAEGHDLELRIKHMHA